MGFNQAEEVELRIYIKGRQNHKFSYLPGSLQEGLPALLLLQQTSTLLQLSRT